MVRALAIELLWIFIHPEDIIGSLAMITVTTLSSHTTPNVPKTVSLVCFYRPLIILSMCSSTTHLADTRPHSCTTLTYESTTHTSFIGSTHNIYREANHALPCGYCLLSFSVCPLGSHNVTCLIALFPMML